MVSCKEHKRQPKSKVISSVSYTIILQNNVYRLLQRSENSLKIISYIPLYPICIENPMNVYIMIGDDYCSLQPCDNMFYKLILYKEWESNIPPAVLIRWFTNRRLKFSNRIISV